MVKNTLNTGVIGGLVFLMFSGSVHAQPHLEQESLLKSLTKMDDYYQAVKSKLHDKRLPTGQPYNNRVTSDAGDSNGQLARGLIMPENNRQSDNSLTNFFGASDADTTTGYRDGKRNPFAPTRQILAATQGRSGQGLNFQPLQQATTIPKMHLKGLINENGKDIAALIEIENSGTYIVREGDTVGLYESGSNSVIRIQKINRLNLVVEAGSLGQVLIVR